MASALLAVLVLGCGTDAPSAADRAATPAPDAAEPRIATLLPFAADQLLEMGVTPVAVPRMRGPQPEHWAGIPAIALDHSAGPNIEQLLAAAPDVVVTTAVYAQFLPAMADATGAEVVVMDVDAMSDVAGNIERLGKLAKRDEASRALQDAVVEAMKTDDAAVAPVRVLAVFGTPHAFYAFLPDTYLGDLVAHAGGELITSDMRSHSVFRGLAPLSMEAVIDRDPDHLLVVFHGSEDSARAMLEADALWGGLRAVRDGQVTFLRDDLYAMRPGSEMPRAIAEIRTIMDGARSRLP